MNPDPTTSHPASEEWSAYLYGELPPERQIALEQHRAACPHCAQQVAQWRATMAALDTWQLPARAKTVRFAPPLLRWAIAAAILLMTGTVAGRLTAPRVNVEQLRAEWRQASQAELQTAVKTAIAETDRRLDDLTQAWAAARAQDQQTTLALHQRAEAQRKTDLAWLRRDLETVALTADERLDTTQRGLSQLAAVSQTYWQRPETTPPRP